MTKILLAVADEKHQIEITKILKRSRYETIISAYSPQFFDQIAALKPSLMIIDGHIAENRGVALREKFQDIPFIAWINERNALLAVNLISSGAFDCIFPPLRSDELLGIAHKAMRSSALPVSKTAVAARKPLPVKTVIAAAIIFLSLFVFYKIWTSSPTQEMQTFTLTYQNPTGIFSTGKMLWTSDWYTQSVYLYKIGRELKLIKTFYFQQFNPGAVVQAGKTIFISGTDGIIRSYQMSKDELIIHETFEPGHISASLCVQDEYLWTVDAENAILFQHLLKKPSQIINQYPYPGLMPVGLYWDGRYFWSADGRANKIYRHSGPENNFQITATFSIIPEGGGTLAGLSGDGRNLWLMFSGQPAKVVKFPMDRVQK